MQTETLTIAGLNSEQNAIAVKAALAAIEGVNDVSVSLLHRQATVQFSEDRVNIPQLQDALAKAGYAATGARAEKPDQGYCCGGCCGAANP